MHRPRWHSPAYGQALQGGILTTGGAITTTAAVAAMIMGPAMPAIAMVIAGIAGIVASIGALVTQNRF